MKRAEPLRRMLGTPTAWLIGMSVAIGSGIFRTPGEVATYLDGPGWVLGAWALGAVIVLAQGLVSAELATRYPRAGGEYVFLREAYGRFPAFFFGWAYTLFIIGGGASAIALALGDFGCDFLRLDARWAGTLAAGAVIAVITINAVGLKVGAGVQNALTVLKIAALIGIIVAGLAWGDARAGAGPSAMPPPEKGVTAPPSAKGVTAPPPRASGEVPTGRAERRGPVSLILLALVPVLWAYDGTTDPVKLAEEIRDVRRAMPRAIVGATLSLAALYVGVNVALLNVIPLDDMRGVASVPGVAMGRLFGPTGARAMLLVAMVVCLGSLSATVLATIRVTYALARDGLTFRFLGRMSGAQSPVAALLVVGAFAVVLVTQRKFHEVLQIYFFAGAILFGLSYGSLLVFRRRDETFPDHVFRCPAGRLLTVLLIALQIALAVNIALEHPRDAVYSCLMMAAFGLLYLVWGRRARSSHDGDAGQ